MFLRTLPIAIVARRRTKAIAALSFLFSHWAGRHGFRMSNFESSLATSLLKRFLRRVIGAACKDAAISARYIWEIGYNGEAN